MKFILARQCSCSDCGPMGNPWYLGRLVSLSYSYGQRVFRSTSFMSSPTLRVSCNILVLSVKLSSSETLADLHYFDDEMHDCCKSPWLRWPVNYSFCSEEWFLHVDDFIITGPDCSSSSTMSKRLSQPAWYMLPMTYTLDGRYSDHSSALWKSAFDICRVIMSERMKRERYELNGSPMNRASFWRYFLRRFVSFIVWNKN